MDKKYKLIHLILIFTLNVACVEEPSTKSGQSKTGLVDASTADTLRFTSGIRAIHQDRKGNYWFGSLQEGVARYNGKSFTYFNSEDGLTDNQIHNIEEDEKGVIWFNTQQGVSSYDGSKIVNHTKVGVGKSQTDFPFHNPEPLQGQWLKSHKDLWFEAGTKEGVYRYDGQKLTYLSFPPHN